MEDESNYYNFMSTFIYFMLRMTIFGVSVYIAIPLITYFNPWILKTCVFANWVPSLCYDPAIPSQYGLDNTQNFYLHVEEGVDIGLWHILPQDKVLEDDISRMPQEKDFSDGNPVILYLHGNAGSRGSAVRVFVYRVLTEMNFHVITLDYRGYGDSTGKPTEDGVVKDCLVAYKWLKNTACQSKIIIWGHSLGSAIATKLSKVLCTEGFGPDGLVLDAPFNNIRDAVRCLPALKPYRILPWFNQVFVDGCAAQGIYFKTDESIKSVTCEILILHDTKDKVIPYKLGQKLYHEALKSRGPHTGGVDLITFYGCGHEFLYLAPVYKQAIRNFASKIC